MSFLIFISSSIISFSQELDIERILLDASGQEELSQLKDSAIPEFKLATPTGDSVFSGELLGIPSLVNLWFVECSPCIEELPMLNELKNIFEERVNFVAITFNTNRDVISLLGNHDFDFMHLTNAKSYLKQIGIRAYPKSLLLDKDNKVIEILDKPFITACNRKDNCIEVISLLITSLLN